MPKRCLQVLLATSDPRRLFALAMVERNASAGRRIGSFQTITDIFSGVFNQGLKQSTKVFSNRWFQQQNVYCSNNHQKNLFHVYKAKTYCA